MPEPGKDSPQTPRILIVDDDPGQRSLLNSFLKNQGFETAVVDSGERALEALRAESFRHDDLGRSHAGPVGVGDVARRPKDNRLPCQCCW